jgi:hypothetical protein
VVGRSTKLGRCGLLGVGLSRVTVRWYAAAVLLAVAAAALVLSRVAWSPSTDCFRSSIALAADGSGELRGCDREAARAVRNHLAERTAADAAEAPSELDARAAFVVWIALFAGTAGLAAATAVRSAYIVADLRPRWSVRLVAFCLGAAVLLGLPFFLFRAVSAVEPAQFGPFDRLHLTELRWLSPLIGLLTLPAAIGLVVVGFLMATTSGIRLGKLAALGSRMRALVGMLGAVLALGVITTAARWQAIATLPGGESVPATVILLWGSVFALVLAALYLPAHQLWRAATEREIEREVQRQLADKATLSGTAGFRAPELALKKELSATLGVGGVLPSLQGSLGVLAPVIAAAVSSLFS